MAEATAVVSAVLFLLCIQVFLFEIALATTYNVGDDAGWNLNVEGWPDGKSFASGDILVFKYDRAHHNVVAVDQNGYDSCTVPPNAKIYQTGNDQITLQQGRSYFICSFPGHCSAGMKIAISAN